MKKHTEFLEGVHEVLGNQDRLQDICLYRNEELVAIYKERQLKWRIQEAVKEGLFAKKARIQVPTNLLNDLADIIDESGCASIKDLEAKEAKCKIMMNLYEL